MRLMPVATAEARPCAASCMSTFNYQNISDVFFACDADHKVGSIFESWGSDDPTPILSRRIGFRPKPTNFNPRSSVEARKRYRSERRSGNLHGMVRSGNIHGFSSPSSWKYDPQPKFEALLRGFPLRGGDPPSPADPKSQI